MRAAIYVRVSSDEQRERGTIATQRGELARMCESQGIEPVAEYADDGVTGTVALEDRPAGAQLLADARRNAFDVLLVWKLDRIGREPWVTLKALHDLESAGVTVRSATESFDRTEPAGRFMSTILSGAAGHERDTMLQRSRAGIRRAAAEGRWVGGLPPYGYRVEGSRGTARLAIDNSPIPGHALSRPDVVRLVYAMAADDRLTCMQIATALHRRGIPTVYGVRPWSAARVRNLIVTTTYMGVHTFGKRGTGGVITRPAPSIVTPETWEAAQRTLVRNRIDARRNTQNQYLLRGLIKCAHCGLTFHGRAVQMRSGRRLNYYRCGGCCAKVDPCGPPRCDAVQVSWQLEDAVWNEVAGFVRNPRAVLAELEERMFRTGSAAWERERDLATLRAELRAKAGERDRILGLYRRGTVAVDVLDRQMQTIDAEERDLTERLQAAQDSIARARGIRAELDATGSLLRRLRAKVARADADFATRRALVEALVAGIRVETQSVDGKRTPVVDVHYRFDNPLSVATRTGAGSSRTTAARRRTA